MPHYITPGDKVQYFVPEAEVGSEPVEQLKEYVPEEEEMQEYEEKHVTFDDNVEVKEIEQPKKKNKDWIFLMVLLLIIAGITVFFK